MWPPRSILPDKIYFSAIGVTENSRIIFLECDKEEDSKELHETSQVGARFKLEKIIEKRFGQFRACLSEMSEDK